MIEKKNKNNIDQSGSLDKCPECGGNAISSGFEKTCKECGLVINEFFGETSYLFNDKNIDPRFYKQYVALGNRPNFIGGLGTFIGYENSKYLRDKSGKLLPPEEQKLYRRLKKNYSHLIRIKNHETEYRIMSILQTISSDLKLNKNTSNKAAYYYKKIVKIEGKVINNISLLAFCISQAAKRDRHNAPIPIKEISEAFQKHKHRVHARLILRDGLLYKRHLPNNCAPHMSEDFITRLVNMVVNNEDLEKRLNKKEITWTRGDLENLLSQKCREILKKLTLKNRGGRNPFILAGAIIYLADKLLAKDHDQKPILTQKIIAKSTEIAEYSIRDHYLKVLKPAFIAKKDES